jgi:hypothetical protein
MARNRPVTASPAEQDADHAARIARDAKSAGDRQAAALEEAGGEAARVAKVQAELGIARLLWHSKAAPGFAALGTP